jgi:hemerythrin-like domain-containing protein
MANAIDRIQSEHSDYARVLSCLLAVVKYLRACDKQRLAAVGNAIRARRAPNLDLLYSIVYYIRVFPDKFHHPKEERHLFTAVRNRSPETGEVLDRLVRQHATGKRQVDELDAALKAYEKNYPNGLEKLAAAAEGFVAAQREHMRLEEDEVIPVAKAVLSEEDWRGIDDAFAGNADPLFGENLETGFHSLHDHIVHGVKAA